VTLPTKVKKVGGNTFNIILTEGKNRQIRRMCEALGAVVKNLHRVRIMNVKIGDLKPGTWRDIPAAPLDQLMATLRGQEGAATPAEELSEE
jgi:23S rRNA pseudouridine2604 synthase